MILASKGFSFQFSFHSAAVNLCLPRELLISLLNTLKNHALYYGAKESFKNFFSDNCSAILNFFLCATKCIWCICNHARNIFSCFFCFLWPSVILLRYTITNRCIHRKRELYTHLCRYSKWPWLFIIVVSMQPSHVELRNLQYHCWCFIQYLPQKCNHSCFTLFTLFQKALLP